jgi:hypothetical protein
MKNLTPVTFSGGFRLEKTKIKPSYKLSQRLRMVGIFFSSDPGGDGSLTATQIEIDELQKFKTPIEIENGEGWIENNLEGIGAVRYFEKQGVFTVKFVAPSTVKTFTGNIHFQICNDVMCMAPTSKAFTLSLKK